MPNDKIIDEILNPKDEIKGAPYFIPVFLPASFKEHLEKLITLKNEFHMEMNTESEEALKSYAIDGLISLYQRSSQCTPLHEYLKSLGAEHREVENKMVFMLSEKQLSQFNIEINSRGISGEFQIDGRTITIHQT
jgi:hypothetical protein